MNQWSGNSKELKKVQTHEGIVTVGWAVDRPACSSSSISSSSSSNRVPTNFQSRNPLWTAAYMYTIIYWIVYIHSFLGLGQFWTQNRDFRGKPNRNLGSVGGSSRFWGLSRLTEEHDSWNSATSLKVNRVVMRCSIIKMFTQSKEERKKVEHALESMCFPSSKVSVMLLLTSGESRCCCFWETEVECQWGHLN